MIVYSSAHWRATCRFPVAVGASLIVLTGCASYQPAPVDLEENIGQFAARRLDEPRLHEALARALPGSSPEWPLPDWNRGQLLAIALLQNPELSVARARTRAALAREVTAGESPIPDLTLESEYARHDAHPWLYGVGLNWLVRAGDRRQVEIDIARLDASSARLSFMNDAWAVRRALADALSERESASRRLALLGKIGRAQDRLLDTVRKRVAAGEDAPGELASTEQERIAIERREAEVREALVSAQGAVARSLGLPPQALDGARMSWPDWGDPPPIDDAAETAARERALLSRSDFGVSIHDYDIAEAKLKRAVLRQYPEFELGPGYYWDHGIAKFPFDVGFSLPLNRNKGEIAEARAGRDLAGSQMLALQATIYAEIATAERAEAVARSNAGAAERQLAAANEQQRHADLGLRLGSFGLEEQLTAELLAARAELELVDARAGWQGARNALENALHTPLSGPELPLAESFSSPTPESGQ